MLASADERDSGRRSWLYARNDHPNIWGACSPTYSVQRLSYSKPRLSYDIPSASSTLVSAPSSSSPPSSERSLLSSSRPRTKPSSHHTHGSWHSTLTSHDEPVDASSSPKQPCAGLRESPHRRPSRRPRLSLYDGPFASPPVRHTFEPEHALGPWRTPSITLAPRARPYVGRRSHTFPAPGTCSSMDEKEVENPQISLRLNQFKWADEGTVRGTADQGLYDSVRDPAPRHRHRHPSSSEKGDDTTNVFALYSAGMAFYNASYTACSLPDQEKTKKTLANLSPSPILIFVYFVHIPILVRLDGQLGLY
ncbi:hypothetical protein BOTBODRAFT_181029 [Botryobasidium botryosum FD-172 SS1]|uniref:Uncharacterized protein n=1 Tax=Botryobasidium botryosum (strain FD-172 SS1) TaxID=930990 RepID=A0A067LV88_BOTB1|nr:hypothetical protein BOTBODRAFT_181029 [Botryobasidium botryosum FD-172 SS1]